MKVVGLTGGIGSGKTTAAGYFQQLGVAVYNSDVRARKLMNQSERLKAQIIDLLGPSAYRGARLNRPWIADRVFGDQSLLDKLNGIVHPAVSADFSRWSAEQSGRFVLKETAILFESGAYERCYAVIVVVATPALRMQRLCGEARLSEATVKDRMARQWTDQQRIARADYLIRNDGCKADLKRTVHEVYERLNRRIEGS